MKTPARAGGGSEGASRLRDAGGPGEGFVVLGRWFALPGDLEGLVQRHATRPTAGARAG